MFGFERIEVWGKAIDFANTVYSLTRESDDRFALTNQMRRAAVAISSNLVEGSLVNSPREFARFVEIAVASLFEVVSHSVVLKKQELLAPEEFEILLAAAGEQGRILTELRRSLLGDS